MILAKQAGEPGMELASRFLFFLYKKKKKSAVQECYHSLDSSPARRMLLNALVAQRKRDLFLLFSCRATVRRLY